VLEFIELGAGHRRPRARTGLAALHRITAAQFGWHRDNTIGASAQLNAWCGDWIEFWRTRRFDFQLALAARNGAPLLLLAKGERLSAAFLHCSRGVGFYPRCSTETCGAAMSAPILPPSR
jgi:hypothetical protein